MRRRENLRHNSGKDLHIFIIPISFIQFSGLGQNSYKKYFLYDCTILLFYYIKEIKIRNFEITKTVFFCQKLLLDTDNQEISASLTVSVIINIHVLTSRMTC